jgi:hypothetical protein
MKNNISTNKENCNESNHLLCPLADLKFIIFHKPTKTEIQMPVLAICHEYSHISFSTSINDYEQEYNGIDRLPSEYIYDYDVYVEINGVRYFLR